jgi:hypothetical protein
LFATSASESKVRALAGWIEVLFLCKGRFDKRTTEIRLRTKPPDVSRYRTGNVLPTKHTGRQEISEEDAERTWRPFSRSPKKCVRQCSREQHIKKTIVHNFLHKRLRFRAYKLHLLQQIKEEDKCYALICYLCSGSVSRGYRLSERSCFHGPMVWLTGTIAAYGNWESQRTYPACQWLCENQCLMWLAPLQNFRNFLFFSLRPLLMLPPTLACLRSTPFCRWRKKMTIFNMTVFLPITATSFVTHWKRGSLVSGLDGKARSLGRRGPPIWRLSISSCGVMSRA